MIDLERALDTSTYKFVGATADFPQNLTNQTVHIIAPGRGRNEDATDSSEVGKDRMRFAALAHVALGLQGNIVACGQNSPGDKRGTPWQAPQGLGYDTKQFQGIPEAFALGWVLTDHINPFLATHGRQPIPNNTIKREADSVESAGNLAWAQSHGFIGERDTVIIAAQDGHLPRLLSAAAAVWGDERAYAGLVVPDDPTAAPDADHPLAGLATKVITAPIFPRWQSPETRAKIANGMGKLVWEGAFLLEGLMALVRRRSKPTDYHADPAE